MTAVVQVRIEQSGYDRIVVMNNTRALALAIDSYKAKKITMSVLSRGRSFGKFLWRNQYDDPRQSRLHARQQKEQTVS